ncbi:probable G-protein coupled receptor 21 [Amphibalanus amphitrite]|uniref:probable G-protein coupled receptor 21 n=1 Tax=Amphibalanus amphitrite TaxID=1232801 RepID=UPI001C927827|nr:probable G-protein coupled receptor 21 [Amphibalanus amphitrite]
MAAGGHPWRPMGLESVGGHGAELGAEALVPALIVLIVCLAVIAANVVIIATIVSMSGPKEVIKYYLLSLAASDLLAGCVVAPLSVYPALVHQWVYGAHVCRLMGYLKVTLWASQAYTLMWIGVDRYLAIVKPLRYDTIQTKVRCQCWVAVSWLSAMVLCCPPVLGLSSPLYDAGAYICLADWSDMLGYSATVAMMVLGPPVITSSYTYGFIFHMAARVRTSYAQTLDKEYLSAVVENLANPDIVMTFVLTVLFWLSWLPYIGLRLFEFAAGAPVDAPFLHFSLFWMGMLNSVWKLLVYLVASEDFRRGLRSLCRSLCCLCRRSASPVPV